MPGEELCLLSDLGDLALLVAEDGRLWVKRCRWDLKAEQTWWAVSTDGQLVPMADTLAVYPRRMLSFRESGLPAVLLGSPFDQQGLAAMGPDGPVIEGDPHFELRQFDPEGRLIAIFRVDGPVRDQSEDALDRYLQGSSDSDRMRRVYTLMGLPDVLPAFQALQVDPLGWYWAELFRPGEAGASEWLVFDREGRARGIVELPRELEVYQIGEDYILGRQPPSSRTPASDAAWASPRSRVARGRPRRRASSR